MHADLLQLVLAYTALALQALAAGTLLARGHLRTWPSLFTSLSFDVITGIAFSVILWLRAPYWLYFYSYWISAAVSCVLRVWMVLDVIRTFRQGFLPVWAYWAAGTFACSLGFASAAFTWSGHPSYLKIAPAVLLMNRSISVGIASVFAGLLIFARFAGVVWQRNGRFIASTLVLRSCVAIICARLLSASEQNLRYSSAGAEAISEIAMLAAWSWFFNASTTWTVSLRSHHPQRA